MDLGLQDRCYIVTGGSRGLGLATARALVADGARVVLAARSAEVLARAAADLGRDRVTPVVADLGDPSAPAALVERARAAYGRLDGALISVGGPPAGSVRDTSDADWTAAFESVLLGGIRAARTVAAALVAEVHGEGGAIAAVLSTSVKAPVAGLAISNGLRPGLAMALKTLADEVGPQGVRVNGLLPGRVDTDRVRELDQGSGDPAATRARHEAGIPLRRYGTPDEFGRVAAFLLSPAASYLTGVMVPVDGGLTRGL